MATLTVQPITISGLSTAYAAADVAGDDFANTGNEFVDVVNGGGAPITVTPVVTSTISTGETITPETVSIPAGENRQIGPFDRTIYNDAAGNMHIDYSDITSVTTAVLQLPRIQAKVSG